MRNEVGLYFYLTKLQFQYSFPSFFFLYINVYTLKNNNNKKPSNQPNKKKTTSYSHTIVIKVLWHKEENVFLLHLEFFPFWVIYSHIYYQTWFNFSYSLQKKVVCELDQQAQITGQNVYDCPALQASPTNRTSQELKIFPLLFVLHKIYLEMHQMKIQWKWDTGHFCLHDTPQWKMALSSY